MPVTISITEDCTENLVHQLRQMFGARVFTDTPALAEKRAEVVEAAASQKTESGGTLPFTPGPCAQLVRDNLTITAPDPTPAEETATQKRTRRTKAEMDAARAAAAAPVEEPKQVDLEEAIAEATPAVEVPTLDDLRAALKRLGNSDGHGHEAVIKLLTEHGAKNASTVAEDKRAAVIAAIDAKLKGGE